MIAKQRKRRIFLQLCSAVPTRMNCLRAPWPRWWGTHKDLTYGTHTVYAQISHTYRNLHYHISPSPLSGFCVWRSSFFPPFSPTPHSFPPYTISIYHLHLLHHSGRDEAGHQDSVTLTFTSAMCILMASSSSSHPYSLPILVLVLQAPRAQLACCS